MKFIPYILGFSLLVSTHVHLFGHHFGVSEGIKNLMLFVSAILAIALFVVGKSLAKKKREIKDTKKITLLNFLIIWSIGLSGPFWMPFTGTTNGYLLDLAAGIVTGLVGSIIIYLTSKDRQKQLEANETAERNAE